MGEWDDFQQFEKLYKKPDLKPEVAVNEDNQEGNLEGKEIPPPSVNFTELEKEKKEQEKRSLFQERLSLFKQYKEIREEHALSNWERHSLDWYKTERKISKKIGKVKGACSS